MIVYQVAERALDHENRATSYYDEDAIFANEADARKEALARNARIGFKNEWIGHVSGTGLVFYVHPVEITDATDLTLDQVIEMERIALAEHEAAKEREHQEALKKAANLEAEQALREAENEERIFRKVAAAKGIAVET